MPFEGRARAEIAAAVNGAISVDALRLALLVVPPVCATSSRCQPSMMPATAKAAGIAESMNHGVPATARSSGAKAVPTAAPMSGARQSAVVSELVTRVPPMSREKAAVNGAMKRICALRPRTSPRTSRHSESGDAVYTRTEPR